ncbi:MAG: response regulator transcription factor [Imperialibacter sp.]|uniref:response regulator transcription factor n=1 Tax=Imperialibacter sp. TaxID=2038411 RepID=UPI003A87A2D3
MNILLIEDEPSVISLIQRSFSSSGYKTSVAMDGETGLQMALNNDFDLIILDLMLPLMSGMEVCKNFRVKNTHTPLLMLTALSTTENIVAGLDGGADDYMTKPFKLAELNARVRTLTRRPGTRPEEGDKLAFSDIELDRATKIVTRAGKKISLTATEFRLLEFLLANRNRVLSRMEILETVWDINFNLGTNVVDVYINYLRKKIDVNSDNKLIHTVFGMGYVMRSEE